MATSESPVVFRSRSRVSEQKNNPVAEDTTAFWDKMPWWLQRTTAVGLFWASQKAERTVRQLLLPEWDPSVYQRSWLTEMVSVDAMRWGLILFALFSVFTLSYRSAVPYTLTLAVPLLTYFFACVGLYYPIITVVFVNIPILELVCGNDRSNPTKEEEEELSNAWRFRAITWLWVPAQLSLMVWAMVSVTRWTLTWPEYILFSISIGVCGGISINTAHELMHRASSSAGAVAERIMSRLLLISVCYGSFYTEHLYGHHKNVSTPYDPASSRRGESLYAFLPRTVVGSFRSAWHIASERNARAGLPWWRHEVLQTTVASLAVAYGAWAIGGTAALGLFLIQSAFAAFMLEVVNYIEHYGLAREPSPHGGYERVRPCHSWNADARITNAFIFKLQRHSDHHAHASRRYQILRSYHEEAPNMPTGYAGMMLLALISPLWFWVMNPLVDRHMKKAS